MYERFTDRSRKVMQYANQSAVELRHEYIGTEHILLGLIKDGSGVATNVLKNMGLSWEAVKAEVEKLVLAGPDPVGPGKLPFTPRTKNVIEYAIEEARTLGHNYVGTEHLLLGCLREGEGVASQVLMNLGLRIQDVREETLSLLGVGKKEPDALPLPEPLQEIAAAFAFASSVGGFDKALAVLTTAKTIYEAGKDANPCD